MAEHVAGMRLVAVLVVRMTRLREHGARREVGMLSVSRAVSATVPTSVAVMFGSAVTFRHGWS